jgi:hypothetical protein
MKTGKISLKDFLLVVDLGMPMVDVARRLDTSPAAVSTSVQRGERTTKDYKLA